MHIKKVCLFTSFEIISRNPHCNYKGSKQNNPAEGTYLDATLTDPALNGVGLGINNFGTVVAFEVTWQTFISNMGNELLEIPGSFALVNVWNPCLCLCLGVSLQ